MKFSKLFKWLFVFCFLILVIVFISMAILGEMGLLGRPVRTNPFFILPILIMALSFIGAFVFLIAGVNAKAAERRRILKGGQTAEAQILKMKGTGRSSRSTHEIDLTLQVYSGNSPAFITKTRLSISDLYIPSYQPGKILIVKFMPRTKEIEIVGPKV